MPSLHPRLGYMGEVESGRPHTTSAITEDLLSPRARVLWLLRMEDGTRQALADFREGARRGIHNLRPGSMRRSMALQREGG